jgi:tRNA nucleotidyltransferase (CCA-adding enzyme)
MTDIEFVKDLAEKVSILGGRVYYVGGYVRDKFMGKENKDIDIEVHGVAAEDLKRLLSGYGKIFMEGVSFGVFRVARYDVDISIPRKETCTGRGHKDFTVSVDPFVGEEKAARRRDFAMNALMENVLTGEVLDFYGGMEDLRQGTIRHVDPASFAEDPLRVLRAAQFAARFEFQVAHETVDLCSRMDLSALSKERVLEETRKALMKSQRPSIFFEALRQMGQLDTWFPEVQALIGVEQDPKHHPEGDVWNHTMMVIDRAASLRGQATQSLFFMMAALCHDMGKPVSTVRDDSGRIRAFGHEDTGVEIAERFLKRLTPEKRLMKYVSNMVLLHMKPNLLANAKAKAKSTSKMFDGSICPEDLLLLSKADRTGRMAGPYDENEAFLAERLEKFREIMSQPHITGRDLIDAGFTPGVGFSEWMEMAHRLRLAGVSKEAALSQLLASKRQQEKKIQKAG